MLWSDYDVGGLYNSVHMKFAQLEVQLLPTIQHNAHRQGWRNGKKPDMLLYWILACLETTENIASPLYFKNIVKKQRTYFYIKKWLCTNFLYVQIAT